MTGEKQWYILCVDDEQDILDSLYDTFMDKYHVKTSDNTQKALEIVNEMKDELFLVISDQKMPLMEGTEFLSKINEIKPTCKKILLTGYSDTKAAIDAINKGSVDKFLSKPWNRDDLVKTVEKLFKDYKTDLMFDKIIQDTKGLMKSSKETKCSLELFRGFLESCIEGICIISQAGAVEYINRAGLDILKYDTIEEVREKSFKEIFLLTDMGLKGFHAKYQNRDPLPEQLYVKSSDGSIHDMLGNITFCEDENDFRVNGIVFKLS
ncbi:hypothetical protein MTBBW1_80231 [Desulfamplus magnetovallimortis]|uniref:Response regulatory domain-containing protein n=1 Tax=Desulfamplus magnetovallimortis TaxID=1246637 RepID=L0R5N5_9BACT|nr:response regulator [Desulfamplus magnetovallimortis]CCO06837.1 hypothetical protein DEMABW1_80231 [Desulfamplus magnetovallimortis BW-1]SLM32888.1 hypothetical protein MTBBW1_80231 [Desulfamplus magnetovallimortis]